MIARFNDLAWMVTLLVAALSAPIGAALFWCAVVWLAVRAVFWGVETLAAPFL